MESRPSVQVGEIVADDFGYVMLEQAKEKK